jgi:hypothetical protein
LGIKSGIDFGGDAEVVEALVCKTNLSGFESRHYLHKFSFDGRTTNARAVEFLGFEMPQCFV